MTHDHTPKPRKLAHHPVIVWPVCAVVCVTICVPIFIYHFLRELPDAVRHAWVYSFGPAIEHAKSLTSKDTLRE